MVTAMRQAARFEGAGGVGAFLLDVEAGVAAAGEHGVQPSPRVTGVDVGQDIGVAPHAEGAGAGSGAGGLLSCFQGVEVVADVEGAGAGGADGLGGVGGDVVVAAGAFEGGDGGHENRVQGGGYRVEGTGCSDQ